eukprot:161630_1
MSPVYTEQFVQLVWIDDGSKTMGHLQGNGDDVIATKLVLDDSVKNSAHHQVYMESCPHYRNTYKSSRIIKQKQTQMVSRTQTVLHLVWKTSNDETELNWYLNWHVLWY